MCKHHHTLCGDREFTIHNNELVPVISFGGPFYTAGEGEANDPCLEAVVERLLEANGPIVAINVGRLLGCNNHEVGTLQMVVGYALNERGLRETKVDYAARCGCLVVSGLPVRASKGTPEPAAAMR